MRRLLRHAGVVDANGDWSWGADRLVIVGDVFDKGPSVTEALWTIRRLERQAAQAGGRVHFLLGNHDHLALRGESRSAGKYADTAAALGLTYADLFGPTTELGRWLRRQDVAAAIGGTLFVHAGLSREFLNHGLSLDETNRLARLRIDTPELLSAAIADRRLADAIASRSGPLSDKSYFDIASLFAEIRAYRGTLAEDASGRAVAERALVAWRCDRMVIGHTYNRSIRALYGGKVIAICAGEGGPDLPDRAGAGQMLVLDHGRPFRVGLNGAREAI